MSSADLADRCDSQLVLIDIQEKLAPAMPAAALEQVLKNCGRLLQAAQLLDIPTLYTEQYPKGLGATLPELTPWLSPASRVEKISFSCCDESTFKEKIDASRHQYMLAGMEAHICVLQTALALHEAGRSVFVVEDAVISRNPDNHHNAMQRLRQAGVIVTNTESVLFEWLRVAEGDAFKQVSKLVR